MADKNVEVPGVGVVAFPGMMSDQDISASIQTILKTRAEHPPTAESQQPFGQVAARQAVRALPFAAGLAATTLAPEATIPAAISRIGLAMAGGEAGTLGQQQINQRLLGQPEIPSDQASQERAGSALLQGGLQLAPELLQGAAAGFKGAAAGLTKHAEAQAAKRLTEQEAAGNVEGKVEEALTTAKSRLKQSAQATRGILKEAAPASKPISAVELADDIISRMKPEARAHVTPAYRTKLISDVRNRNAEVFNQFSLGAAKTGAKPAVQSKLLDEFGQPITTPAKKAKLAHKLMEGQFLKQAFTKLNEPEFNAISRGFQPKPELDTALQGAWARAIERRAPEVKLTNRQTQQAIRQVRQLSQLSRQQKDDLVREIRLGQKISVAKAGVRNPAPSELVGVHLSPVPGVSVNPPPPAQFFGGAADIAGHPLTQHFARYGPRLGALLLDQLQGPLFQYGND